MTEDWAAVARTIDKHLTALGWRQRELAERTRVSQATTRELQYNSVQRRRSTRTLEALSTGLGLHPNHLTAILRGRLPPESPAQAAAPDSETSRLNELEGHVAKVSTTLEGIQANLTVLLQRVVPRPPHRPPPNETVRAHQLQANRRKGP